MRNSVHKFSHISVLCGQSLGNCLAELMYHSAQHIGCYFVAPTRSFASWSCCSDGFTASRRSCSGFPCFRKNPTAKLFRLSLGAFGVVMSGSLEDMAKAGNIMAAQLSCGHFQWHCWAIAGWGRGTLRDWLHSLSVSWSVSNVLWLLMTVPAMSRLNAVAVLLSLTMNIVDNGSEKTVQMLYKPYNKSRNQWYKTPLLTSCSFLYFYFRTPPFQLR